MIFSTNRVQQMTVQVDSYSSRGKSHFCLFYPIRSPKLAIYEVTSKKRNARKTYEIILATLSAIVWLR